MFIFQNNIPSGMYRSVEKAGQHSPVCTKACRVKYNTKKRQFEMHPFRTTFKKLKKQLHLQALFACEQAADMLYTSNPFTHLADYTTGLYLKP
jgi:hypothetical protein